MSEKAVSGFQEVIECVEALSSEDQALLVDIIHQRLIEQRREELAADITEARDDYYHGRVRRGSVKELLEELKE